MTEWNFGRATVAIGRSFCRTGKTSHKRTEGRGYTIIEVMIFLAVSGFMFVLAAIFISGKQASVSYRQGITAAGSAMSAVANSVANGEFPGVGNFSCTSSGVGPTFTVGNKSQGMNRGCIFLGKAVQFNPNGDPTQYNTYTIAGCQFKQCSTTYNAQPSQSLTDAMPVAVISPIDLTQTSTLEDGLAFSQAYLCNNASCSLPNPLNPIGGIVFFGSFGSAGAAVPNSESSGAQSVSVATLPPANGVNAIRTKIANTSDYTVLTSQQHIVICFKYGSTDGAVTIGGNSGQLAQASVTYGKVAPCS